MTEVALSTIEQNRLQELEVVIEKGLQTFVEVGNALLEIRESKLYRASHGTFEAYCKARWGFIASRTRQLIGAAETVKALESVTDVTPANEAQARELAPLRDDPEAMASAWLAAVEATQGKPTAAAVASAVHRQSLGRRIRAGLGRLEEIKQRWNDAIHADDEEAFSQVFVEMDGAACELLDCLRDGYLEISPPPTDPRAYWTRLADHLAKAEEAFADRALFSPALKCVALIHSCQLRAALPS